MKARTALSVAFKTFNRQQRTCALLQCILACKLIFISKSPSYAEEGRTARNVCCCRLKVLNADSAVLAFIKYSSSSFKSAIYSQSSREISNISLLALFTNTVLPYSVFKHANDQMQQTRHISMHLYHFILFIVAILQPTEPLIHTPVLTSVCFKCIGV